MQLLGKVFLRPTGIEAEQIKAALPLLIAGQLLPLHVFRELQAPAFGFRDRIVDDLDFQLGHAHQLRAAQPAFAANDGAIRQADQRLQLPVFQAFAEPAVFRLVEALADLRLSFEPG